MSAGLHTRALDSQRLIHLAPAVLAAATTDAVALALVQRQAGEVAAQVSALLDRLGLRGAGVEVVLGGALLTARDAVLHPLVLAGLARVDTTLRPLVLDAPPVLGAVRLGLAALDPRPSVATPWKDRGGRHSHRLDRVDHRQESP